LVSDFEKALPDASFSADCAAEVLPDAAVLNDYYAADYGDNGRGDDEEDAISDDTFPLFSNANISN